MRSLLADPAEARRLGDGARRRALERFHIDRFARDWEETFALVDRAAARAGRRSRPAWPWRREERDDRGSESP